MSRKGSTAERLAAVQDRSTVRLTTRGRKTGKAHMVTVWFLAEGETVYLVTMSLRRDWPRNIVKNGHAELDFGDCVFSGRAKPVKGARVLAHIKGLLNQKYWMAWLGSWVGFGPEGAFAVTFDR
jgi:deazaflavin-dependent oxidoreductase (nitroreductase family)